MADSLPVAVCDNIRIRRCRLYPLKEYGEAFRGYIVSKRRYFYGLRVHLVVTGAGEPVEFSLARGSLLPRTSENSPSTHSGEYGSPDKLHAPHWALDFGVHHFLALR